MITHEQAKAIMAKADELISKEAWFSRSPLYIALVDAKGGPESTLAKLIRNSDVPWPTQWDGRTWPCNSQELEIGGKPCGIILFVGTRGGCDIDLLAWVSLLALFTYLIQEHNKEHT